TSTRPSLGQAQPQKTAPPDILPNGECPRRARSGSALATSALGDYDFSPSSAKFSRKMLTRGSPISPKAGRSIAPSTSARTRSSGSPRALATEATCASAVDGDTSGSSPEADVVTASAGTGPGPAIARHASTPAFTRSTSVFEVGPRLEPDELAAL